jgi:orotidine-5'-phosphate decarboxylase
MDFIEKLQNAVNRNNTLLCIGLDPNPKAIPANIDIFEFNRAIIDSTLDLVCAYKPNLAFYEALGNTGIEALRQTVRYIPEDIAIIADAKRADIGNTSKAYAQAVFDELGADAATVNPYLGYDALEPFIEYRSKGVIILCRTSNPGASDFQSLICKNGKRGKALYEIVADKASQWNKYGNIGLVVGATYPDELKLLRRRCPDMPFLIPGIGAQGGDVETTVKNGISSSGDKAIINSARQIIYASNKDDFAEAARAAAILLKDEINKYRNI